MQPSRCPSSQTLMNWNPASLVCLCTIHSGICAELSCRETMMPQALSLRPFTEEGGQPWMETLNETARRVCLRFSTSDHSASCHSRSTTSHLELMDVRSIHTQERRVEPRSLLPPHPRVTVRSKLSCCPWSLSRAPPPPRPL